MKISALSKIDKLFFTTKDVGDALGISRASARVTCARYTKSGLLRRLKRGFYTLPANWKALKPEDCFIISNMLEVPSYISLTTALSFYDISTQMQRDFFESISLKRTKEVSVEEKEFVFKKIKRPLYGGFKRTGGYFIATPEKALLDAVYLASLNRYSLDLGALDLGKIDRKALKKELKKYPATTLKFWRTHIDPSSSRR